MRKLNLLKAIVDYVWIMSIICYPIIIVIAFLLVMDKGSIDIPLKIAGSEIILNNNWSKTAFLIGVLNFAFILYALFLFRKLLSDFKQKQIFEIETCMLLNKIGKLIIFASILCLLTEVFIMISKSNTAIEFGYGPFVYLLALGLFFRVLSEVFKMGKHIKEENELTI